MTARIIHIIVGLDIGGAELMLKRLIVSFSTHPTYVHSVISLTSVGVVGSQLRAAGVDVRSLNMNSAASFPIAFWRLVLMIRAARPSIVQTWMYHSDFLGGWAARILGCKVVWGIRSSAVPQGISSFTWWLVRINAICSHFVPHKIVCCANSAKDFHSAIGFATRKLIVIANGYDFSSLVFTDSNRIQTRRQLGFLDTDVVIGNIGRFDPLKDFQNFIKAAKIVALMHPGAKFLMVGRNLDANNLSLANWIFDAGLTDKFTLVGERLNTLPFMCAMDIFCLSSKHEGFPNVVVEAMAARLLCVVTQAGDASLIVGDCGLVVPVQDSLLLGQALLAACKLSPLERMAVGAKASSSVRARFGIKRIRHDYEDLYANLLSTGH